MTEDTRTARTERLLIARLDALAKTAASLPHAETERLVELATIATMRAVALDRIWREARERNPSLRLPTRLAA